MATAKTPKSNARFAKPKPARQSKLRREMRVFNSFEEAEEADRQYWWSQTPAYRMRALERLRERNYRYGQGRPLPRFQRTLKIAELGRG